MNEDALINPENKELDRLLLALRASNEGVWKWDLEANEIIYSDRLLSFIGYPAEEAPHLFHNLSSLYHEEDYKKLQDCLDEVFSPNGPEIFGANCRFLHPSNTWRWLRIRGACIRNENKQVIMLAGSVIDITRRKTAELDLEEDRHVLNLLVESIPVNVYFKDKESKFRMSNTATALKMGLPNKEAIIGTSDHTFFDAKHADKSRKDEVSIMETLQKHDGNLEKETWPGQPDSWCITSKQPWLDNKGRVKGTFGVTNDVTDMVNIQTRLVNVAQALKDKNQTFKEELDLATEVQQSILTKHIPPLTSSNYTADFTTEYIPMSGLAGDFYEIIPISESKMGILMCDVMGHGIRASLIVAMLRGLITKEVESAHQPDSFLYGLNQGLIKIMSKAGITMFATAIYIVIDLESKLITLADAGHPLPIVRKGNTFQQLTPPGYKAQSALGLVPETLYNSHTIHLSMLSELILFTDGIYEIENKDGEELEIEGVIRLLNEISTQEDSQSHSIEKLINSLRSYATQELFNDDVCMVSASFKSS